MVTILRPVAFLLLVSALALLNLLLAALVMGAPAYFWMPLLAMSVFMTGMFWTRYLLDLIQELI